MKTRRLNLKLVDCGTCCLLMLCPKVIFWFRVWYSQLGAAAWPSIFCLPNIHGKTDFPGSHKKKKSKGAYAVARGGGKWSKHAERNSARTHVRYTICTLIILPFSLSRIHAHTCACTQALSCRVDKPVLSGAIVWLACCPVILSCSPSSFLFERSRFCLLLFLSQFQRTSAGINPQVECKVDAGHLKHWKKFFF